MKIDVQTVVNGWKLYTLTNEQGMRIRFLNYGGIITEIIALNKDGLLENVVLGYKDYQEYKDNPNYFGAIIGRVAGRIQGASFTINGNHYNLEANEGMNHLHGGSGGLHQVIWEVEPFSTESAIGVTLTYTSTEEESGYPGNVTFKVTYTLNSSNEFIINYEAMSDKDTVLTLTNHSYFNLSGDLSETVHQHQITMNSSTFIELDDQLIPTGKILDVDGTAFDFRGGKKITEGIHATDYQNIIASLGYDHYFIFDQQEQGNIKISDEKSGRVLEIKTNEPGVVLYTGNSLANDLELKEGMSKPYLGVCFETQAPPAGLHHEGLPSMLLKAHETYAKETVFSFSIQ